ncbi:C40 family peptidase [Polaromonas sp. P1(28)-13]|nr:C40 family peptidase [Polaromonas sp. P1(28)-13]
MADPADLVGVPFVYGGRGPDSFDCYGLVMHILKCQHSQDIPDFRSTSDRASLAASFANGVQAWQEVPPAAGAVVLFRIGRYISHCGYMLDSMRMIHTWEDSGGVVIERADTWKRRTVGFYRYLGYPNAN